MTERAQVSGGPWLAGGVIVGVIVLAIVVAEARSQVAAVEGPVDYCGLCHVEPWLLVTALLALPLGVGVLLRIRSGRWRR